MGIQEFQNELELLRASRLDQKIDSAEYNARIVECITEISARWKSQRAENAADAKEMERIKEKIGELIQTQDSPGKFATLRALIGTEILDDRSYAAACKLICEYSFNKKQQLQDSHHYDAAAKTVFGAAIKELSKVLDQVGPAQRLLIFAGMDDKLVHSVIASLPAAQQLKIKRELITSGRRVP